MAARRVSSTGTAQLTTKSLPVGSDSITATFRASADFASSTSTTPLAQTVNADGTTTSITSRPNPSTFGQTVTLVASVTANTPGGGRPGGTVAFEVVGGATLGTVNIGCGGTARFTTNTLAIGSYTIEAVFTPSNANFIASTSTTTVTQVVNQATPKVKLSTPPGSFPIAVGGSLTVTATVGASGFGFGNVCGFGGSGSSTTTPPTGLVEFYLNGGPATPGSTPVGTLSLSSGQATFTFTNLPQGTDVLTVYYEGDSNYAPATGTLTVTVPTPTKTSGGTGGTTNNPLQTIFANWGALAAIRG